MLRHASPVPIHFSRGELMLPRAVYAWVNDPGRETAEPMSDITDEQIADLQRLVDRERKQGSHPLTTREHILLAGIDKAIQTLKNERDRNTRARMILTMVWNSRKLLAGDFWAVTDRELDAMACRMVEMYFGGPYHADSHPHRRRTDGSDKTH